MKGCFAFAALWVAAWAAAAAAQDGEPRRAPPVWKAALQPNGAVQLTCDGEEFGIIAPSIFADQWKHVQLGDDAAERDAGGMPRPVLVGPNGETVEVTMRVEPAEGGAIRFAYELRPREPTRLQGMNVALVTPYEVVSGGRWTARPELHRDIGVEGEIPEELQDDVRLFAGNLTEAGLRDAKGRRLQFVFAEPIAVLFQDNRRWNPTFTIRCGYHSVLKAFTPDTPLKIEFELSADGPIRMEGFRLAAVAPEQWAPVAVELDIAEGSALDFSRAPWMDAPAGRQGRLIARPDGAFAFEKAPDAPRRFYGVNLCFSAVLPDRAQADRLADRFARLGYNAVRWHHFERDLAEPRNSSRPSAAALDRLQYFFAALKKRGIYVAADLYASRAVPAAAVWPGAEGALTMEEYKLLLPVNARAEEDLREFTRRWLGAKNPHTGVSLAADPALAWISLVNENTPSNYWEKLSPRVAAEWRAAWNRWLEARYPRPADLSLRWGADANFGALFRNDALPNTLADDTPRGRDFAAFLAETQRAFYERTARFLREELKCQALLTDLNGWTQRRAFQWTRSAFDYADDHFYVDHPEFLEQPWQLPSRIAGRHPARPDGAGGAAAAFTRLYGKPFVVSEYNYAAPGPHRGAGGLLTGALAALQDWSAVFRFAYSHSLEKMFAPDRLDYFDLASDPLNLAADRVALLIFLRGDLAPSPLKIVLAGAERNFVGPEAVNAATAPPWAALAFVARVGHRIGAPAGAPAADEWTVSLQPPPGAPDPMSADAGSRILAALRADGRLGEDNASNLSGRLESVGGALNLAGTEGSIRLDTPRTAGAVGAAGHRLRAGALEVELLDAPAALAATSLDGRPLRESRRILVTHLTDLRNTDQRFDPRKGVLSDWGRPPVLARNGRAAVRIERSAPPRAARAWALSTGGRRLAETPARIEPDGAVAIECDVIGPEGARLLYELEIE